MNLICYKRFKCFISKMVNGVKTLCDTTPWFPYPEMFKFTIQSSDLWTQRHDFNIPRCSCSQYKVLISGHNAMISISRDVHVHNTKFWSLDIFCRDISTTNIKSSASVNYTEFIHYYFLHSCFPAVLNLFHFQPSYI